jgi:hypothetical protein
VAIRIQGTQPAGKAVFPTREFSVVILKAEIHSLRCARSLCGYEALEIIVRRVKVAALSAR